MELKSLPGVGATGASGLTRPAAAGASTGPGFARALDSALKGVSQLQQESSAMQRQYQLGSDAVSLEDTMVAMQKAQIGFQAAVTVRNRLVSAYTDIMNMQV